MRRRLSRSLRFEGLEQRAMLAGDVQISVAQNTLQISGDTEANHVIIEGGNGGSLTITGANGTELFFGVVDLRDCGFDGHLFVGW